MHLDSVELREYISILKYKAFFTSFWSLKRHDQKPMAYTKSHGTMRVSTTAY